MNALYPETLPDEPEIWAIIPAAGSGSRFSAHQNKLLMPLAGTPVLVRTLQVVLLGIPGLRGVILAASAEQQAVYRAFISSELPDAPVHCIEGGRTRRESVAKALAALPETADIVVIHDAARPLASPALFERAIQAVREGKAGAIAALPIHDTVKKASGDTPTIAATVDRSTLWRAQTPQVFQAQLLAMAHRRVSEETPVTDDAQLMELAGLGPVALTLGDERNLKITTEADLAFAEAVLPFSDGSRLTTKQEVIDGKRGIESGAMPTATGNPASLPDVHLAL